MRIFVQFFGRIGQHAVDFRDLAADRRVDVGDRFHRFHRAEGLALFQMRADLRQIHVDDVAQFLLGVVGDADGAGIALHEHPLVFLGVAEIFWIHVYFARL